MSLILDALKKAQKESGPGGTNKPPALNPILQDDASKKRIRILAIAVVCGLVLLGGLLWSRQKNSPTTKSEPVAVLPTPVQNTATQTDTAPQNGHTDPNQKQKEQAIALYKKNNLEESLAIWEEMILETPTDPEAYNNAGLVLRKQGKLDDSIKKYEQAIALKGDYPEALNNLGVALHEKGDTKKAKEYFNKAIDIDMKFPATHFNLAILLEQEGNFKESVIEYKAFVATSKTAGHKLESSIEKKLLSRIEQLESFE